jgi:hypothetical protein
VGLFQDIDSPISLRFLERFPSAPKAAWLSEKRLAAWLKANSYTGGKNPVCASSSSAGAATRNSKTRSAASPETRGEETSGPNAVIESLRKTKTHPHATRILARSWAQIIWRCWQDRVPYDPALHGGFQRLSKEAA